MQFLGDVVLQVVDAEELFGPRDVLQKGLFHSQHLFRLGLAALHFGVVETDQLVLKVLDIGRGDLDVLQEGLYVLFGGGHSVLAGL